MHRRTWLHATGSLALTGGLWGCRRTDAGLVVPAASTDAGAKDRWAALSGFCDGIEAPTDEEREHQRERMRRSLAYAGHDVLVVEAGATLQFLTGVRWGRSERPFLLALPRAGEPWWVVPAFEERTAREQLGDATILAWHEHESPYAVMAKGLRDSGLSGGTIAVDPQLRSFVVEGLRGAMGATAVVDGAAAVEAVRMRKQPSELARLRRANEATKAALRLVASEGVAEGIVQSELAQNIRDAQTAAGLQDIWVLALFGPNASFPHGTAEDRALRAGDAVLVDTGGSLHGYRSDITRTWVHGEASAKLRSAWATVAQAQAAALEMIRPGVACGAVDAAARAVIDGAGFGPDYRYFTHRLGHGIGLEVHEAPYLVRDAKRILEPGMTMSNEPGIYVPNELGVRIEDIVAVTDDGHEVFGPMVESLEAPFGA